MLNPATTLDGNSPRGDHGAFLYRAAHDPRFRTALEADPQTALAEYGLSIDPQNIPSEVRVPSAESIQGALLDAEDSSEDRTWIPWRGLFGG